MATIPRAPTAVADPPRSAPAPRLLPAEWGRASRAAALSIVGVTLFVLLLDGWLFRGRLDPGYLAFYRSPLIPRTLLAMRGALGEELVIRLLLMTLLWVGLAKAGLRPLWVAALAIGGAQFVNIMLLLPLAPLYVTLRFWLVGAAWGYLYWRHGWVTAAAAHPLCHLLLDPLLRATLFAAA